MDTIRCRRCKHALGRFTGERWRFDRIAWIDIEAGIARIKCANRDPFNRGACGEVTCVRVCVVAVPPAEVSTA
jgi:hypothetical protein